MPSAGAGGLLKTTKKAGLPKYLEYFGNPAVYWRPNVVGTLFKVAVTGCGLCQALAQRYRAGRKSMGYRIVVFGTPSLAPKLNFLTLSTIWVLKSGAFILQDSTPQAETAPLGSMVIRSTIFPRRVGSLRNSVL